MKIFKKLYLLLFVFLLLVLSFITVENYNMLKNKQYNYDRFVHNYGYDIQLFLFNIIEEYDSEYQFIQINETGEEEHELTYVYNELGNVIRNFSNNIQGDANFQYIVKQKGSYISNEFDLNASKLYKNYHRYYEYIRFDENGEIDKCEGQLCSYFQNNTLSDYTYLEYTDNTYYEVHNNIWLGKDSITLNYPKNAEFYILTPYNIVPSGFTYNQLTMDFEPYVIFTCIFTGLALVVLSIFIFLTPMEKLCSINPYKTIKNWLIEINFFAFGGLLVFIGALAIFLCKYTLDGTLEYYVSSSEMNISDSFLGVINFITWTIFYYFLTIIPFLMKYIFNYGLLNYIKDYTLLGRCWLKVKKELSNIQIGYKVILLTILAFVIPAGLGIGAIYLFAEVGLILTIIGYVFAFIFALVIENKIYDQYKILLDKTNQLAQGNFDIQIDENLGLFEDYKKELLQVKDGFEKAVQEEVKSTNMKTELITNVSHDLKTPITCIKNYVTLLENEDLDKETQKEYIKNLHQYTNRLTHLVEDLFEVSKVNSGNISLELVELNIVELVKQVLAENEDIFTQSNLNVVTKFENDHITCLLDGDKTYRIFENLITNIGKYALPRTRVYVDMIQFDNQVQITFKNISKDEMNFTSEEIVERFVRGDKSRHEQGSGIGLAIVKSYTEIQNGTFNITVDGDLFKAILTFKC